MGKYAAKFLPLGTPAPSGWVQVGNIAIDIEGIASSNDMPFVPGVDDSYDINGYIIISDTTSTGLNGRSTGGNTGVVSPDTPTFWATTSKTDSDFLNLVSRLPNMSGINTSPTVDNISNALSDLASNGYWTSYDNTIVFNVDAANSNSYPGTGLTWYDLSSYENNGTISNAVYYSSGPNSVPSFYFDGNYGTSDSVSIGGRGL